MCKFLYVQPNFAEITGKLHDISQLHLVTLPGNNSAAKKLLKERAVLRCVYYGFGYEKLQSLGGKL